MRHGQLLRQLLSPLRVYDVDAPFNGGELDSQGQVLDRAEEALEEQLREGCLATAWDWGLEQTAQLFRLRPAADGDSLRQALAALIRIGGDSFTPADINDAITGCGIHAQVEEGKTPGRVTVSFPQVPGVPEGFESIKAIIEDILPAHVLVEYAFWFMTWAELERKLPAWTALEGEAKTWTALETYVL